MSSIFPSYCHAALLMKANRLYWDRKRVIKILKTAIFAMKYLHIFTQPITIFLTGRYNLEKVCMIKINCPSLYYYPKWFSWHFICYEINTENTLNDPEYKSTCLSNCILIWNLSSDNTFVVYTKTIAKKISLLALLDMIVSRVYLFWVFSPLPQGISE